MSAHSLPVPAPLGSASRLPWRCGCRILAAIAGLAVMVLVSACTRADTDLARFNQELQAIDPMVPNQGQELDSTRMLALTNATYRLGVAFLKLNEADRAIAKQHTPARLSETLGISIWMAAGIAEKNDIISKGWAHPCDYYTRILNAARTATPPDGKDHAFTVDIAEQHVSLTPISEIPEAQGASTSKLVAKIVDGKLIAGYVFNDMGHAGIWGILFSDVEVPLHTAAYNGGPRYWMFSDVGEQLYPHIYQAWNNID